MHAPKLINMSAFTQLESLQLKITFGLTPWELPVTGEFQIHFTKVLVVNDAVLVVLSHCLVQKSAYYASAGMVLRHVTT